MKSQRLYRFKHHLLQFEKYLAAASLLLLLGLTLSQAIARNIFSIGIPHIDVIARHLVLFISFMGAAIVSEHNKHIKIDILSSALNAQQKQRLQKPLFFLTSLVCFVFTFYAIEFWLDEWNYAPANERLAVYMACIIPLGFFILAIHLLLLALGIEADEDCPP